MDRCAIFVDAGYLLAEAGAICCGRKRRSSSATCNYLTLTAALAEYASTHSHLPVLRIYWYDGAPNAVPTTAHQLVGGLPRVKLRLGRLVGSKQKGVDSLVYRDLMTLAREKAMATAYLLSGDEDLKEGVVAAQDMGVRVILLGIPPEKGSNQSDVLIREADEHVVIESTFWLSHFSKLEATEAEERPKPGWVGAQFATAWVKRATTDECLRLHGQYPRIPEPLDAELLLDAEGKLGPLENEAELRNSLRAGFWSAFQHAAKTLKSH